MGINLETFMLPIRLIIYNLSRKLNRVFILPMNYTYSITSICDSKCKSCNIWKKNEKDLTKEQWKKIIKSIGPAPYWITITGGNQFLRTNFNEIMAHIIKYNKPKIINIPASGTQPDLVRGKIEKLLALLKGRPTKLIINVSLDGIEKKQDEIRGSRNCFDNTVKLIRQLKKLQETNSRLIVGTYTIISKYNYKDYDKIRKYIESVIKPDHHGFELAEERYEYENIGEKLLPGKGKCKKIMNKCLENNSRPTNTILRYKNSIRKKYYRHVLKTIDSNHKIIDCYAGIASIQISNSGEVWQCCTKTKIMGDLKKYNYDFKKLFFSKRANLIRKTIKKCYCTHSNPFYTNYLCRLK